MWCVRLHKLIYSLLRGWISSWIRSASDTPQNDANQFVKKWFASAWLRHTKAGGRPGEDDAKIQLRQSFNSRRGKNTFPSHRFRTEQRRRDKRTKQQRETLIKFIASLRNPNLAYSLCVCCECLTVDRCSQNALILWLSVPPPPFGLEQLHHLIVRQTDVWMSTCRLTSTCWLRSEPIYAVHSQ